MNDIVIRAIGLSKIFRLYSKPHYRFLDMFGLLNREDAYQEHAALKSVDLEISRGEKVAFIGRNGAGKSTLLRLITGVTQPTQGSLHVSQGANALLQIGTGFYPDFSGRENARAYLAHLGVVGREADKKIAGIVEFSELEEYIDQPVKTYSSGMMARLMFATSTAIAPDLLVLDEILGVGDAYFSNKSFERIKELSEQEKTTVLLVSHDVYSAAKLCGRMIWIDRGAKLMDGASEDVIRAYENSIRIQEESRLRAKAIAAVKPKASDLCVLELSVAQQQPLHGRLLVNRIAITDLQSGHCVEFPLTSESVTEQFEPALGFVTHHEQTGQSVLSEAAAVKRTRLTFEPDKSCLDAILTGQVKLEICYQASHENMICVDLWYKEQCQSRTYIRVIPGEVNGGWVDYQQNFEKPSQHLESQSVVMGSGRIWLETLEVLDTNGIVTFVFEPRDHLRLRCHYRTFDNQVDPFGVEFLIAIHRDGVSDCLRMVSAPIEFSSRSSGILEFSTSGWELARGRFTFTLIAVKPGYYDHNDGKFFAINDDVYCCINRGVEILIDGGSNQFSGTNVRVPMTITIAKEGLSE